MLPKEPSEPGTRVSLVIVLGYQVYQSNQGNQAPHFVGVKYWDTKVAKGTRGTKYQSLFVKVDIVNQ